MINPHSACNTIVFESKDQVNTCANSLAYKRNTAIPYAIFGFFIAIIIGAIVASFFISKDATGKQTNTTMTALIFVLILISITFMSYNYGYQSADYESVLMAYNQDQQELASRTGFKTREDNVADLIRDRQRIADVRENERRSGYGNRNQSNYNNLNLGNGFNVRF